MEPFVGGFAGGGGDGGGVCARRNCCLCVKAAFAGSVKLPPNKAFAARAAIPAGWCGCGVSGGTGGGSGGGRD